MYTYLQSEPGLWTVGYHDPSGRWHPDSDHDKREDAARRVHYLNGGNVEDPRVPALIKALEDAFSELNQLAFLSNDKLIAKARDDVKAAIDAAK